MTETLTTHHDIETVYEMANSTDISTQSDTRFVGEDESIDYDKRQLSKSEQHLRDNILDYDMLARVARGMAWSNNNAGDVAYYAARALGRADGDEEWQINVATVRNSTHTLHMIADDPATEHYGNDEHILLETIVAMCNLDESWSE
jgi:hypothetical protein